MKVFKRSQTEVSKPFALKASLYRRTAKAYGYDDQMFSKEMLIEMYNYESKGQSERPFHEMKKDNGYAVGKWLRDIDVANMIEGVRSGDFAKIEFLDTPIKRIHNQSVLDNVIVSPFFGYDDQYKAKAIKKAKVDPRSKFVWRSEIVDQSIIMFEDHVFPLILKEIEDTGYDAKREGYNVSFYRQTLDKIGITIKDFLGEKYQAFLDDFVIGNNQSFETDEVQHQLLMSMSKDFDFMLRPILHPLEEPAI